MFGETITQMDAPEHRRYRALFQQAFAPNMLDGWREDLVPRIVNELIDRFVERGEADLVGEFALHFPFQFITELLALPAADRTIFHKLAFAQTTSRYDPQHAAEAGGKLTSYLRALIAERRDNPPSPDDFVHVMATAQVDGETLPEIVIVSFLRQLMNAAGDTSYHGFSNLMAGLMANPDQLAAIRSDRSLIPLAAEEALRWEAPIVNLERSPAQTVELHGITIHPGDRVYASIGGANRDGSVFEDPDRFDIHRKRQRHMAFGQGPHICIGQHLARVEMVVALNALLDRLANLRLDPDAPFPTVYGVSLRKPKAVRVRFG
jgi:cytochrome P450